MVDIQSATAENRRGRKRRNYNVGLCPTWWLPSDYRWRPLLKMIRSRSSIIPFLVPCHKVWLSPTARVRSSNAANVEECETWMQSEFCTWQNSVRGTSPKMYIWCTSLEDSQIPCKVWLTSIERCRCSNEAKTRNPLKFAGGPKHANRCQPLVGWNSPCCEDVMRRCCCLTRFFSDCGYRP